MTSDDGPSKSDVTVLLRAVRDGRDGADSELLAAIYDELRRLARGRIRHERPGRTLEATELVHEAWLKLSPASGDWQDRRHFFGAASRAMRQILVDRHRRRRERPTGSDSDEAAIELAAPDDTDTVDLLALDEALTALEAHDPRMARIAQLRFFGGLGVDDIAAAMDVSPRTVKREWAVARGWLLQRMGGG